ncbi:MAG: hypothetical protein WD877_01400 [Candidatus Saccharimonadales bacterium]
MEMPKNLRILGLLSQPKQKITQPKSQTSLGIASELKILWILDFTIDQGRL